MKLNSFLYFLSFSLSLIVIFYRFYIGTGLDYDLLDNSGYLIDGTLFLWLDEVTYLTWLDVRYEAFFQMMSGERDQTNIFGYIVGGLYWLFGSWLPVIFLGMFGWLLFYFSSKLLIKTIPFNSKYASYAPALFMLCPTVIMLSSGVLRDLYLISLVNFAIYFSYKRQILKLFFVLIIIFFLRSFYVVAIFPMLAYFYFFFSKNRTLITCFSSLIPVSAAIIVVISKSSIYTTGYEDVLFRFFTVITGFSIEIARPQDNISKGYLYTMEYLGLIFQFLCHVVFYIHIIKNKLRFHAFAFVIISMSIMLAIIYGYFLGYFVSRTKLILTWSMFLYFMLSFKKSNKV